MEASTSSTPRESTPLCTEPIMSEKGGKMAHFWAGTGAVGWACTLVQAFGLDLLVMLFASQHILKGFANVLCAQPAQFVYREYGVVGPRMQVFAGVTMLPWAVKPVIGMISDLVPIRGLHKAPYIVGASILGVFACSMLGFLPAKTLPIELVVVGFFLLKLQVSTCDLLTEAKYAEKMQSQPQHGPALMTFVWGGIEVGSILAILLAGLFINQAADGTVTGAHTPFALAVPFLAIILWPTFKGYLGESRVTAQDLEVKRSKVWEQKELVMLCVLMCVSTVAMTACGILIDSITLNFVLALIVMLTVLTAFSLVLSPTIAKVNAFFLIQTSMSASVGGATFYFFTDGPEAYPEGPHFSTKFYLTVLGVVASGCSIIGVATYQKYLSSWKYRSLILMTNVLMVVLSLFDLVLFLRWNRKLGIPDQVFVLGFSSMGSVISQWMWLPGVVILSRLCPKGMEAMMYALLAGAHNLGMTVSSNFGAFLLEQLAVRPSGKANETAQFENLWVAALVSAVLPFLTLALLWMIPDARQTEHLLGGDSATHGSVYRRWKGLDDSVAVAPAAELEAGTEGESEGAASDASETASTYASTPCTRTSEGEPVSEEEVEADRPLIVRSTN